MVCKVHGVDYDVMSLVMKCGYELRKFDFEIKK